MEKNEWGAYLESDQSHTETVDVVVPDREYILETILKAYSPIQLHVP